MKIICLTIFVVCMALAGCVTSAKKLSEVSVGMSKSQVMAILGEPASVSASGEGELLRYQLRGSGPLLSRPDGRPATGYTVQLKDGKVVAFGRDDEFRSLRVNVK